MKGVANGKRFKKKGDWRRYFSTENGTYCDRFVDKNGKRRLKRSKKFQEVRQGEKHREILYDLYSHDVICRDYYPAQIIGVLDKMCDSKDLMVTSSLFPQPEGE